MVCAPRSNHLKTTLGDSVLIDTFAIASRTFKRLWWRNQTSQEVMLKYLNILVFYCTLLVSNKNIFAHLFTLCVFLLTIAWLYWHPNNKSLEVSEGGKELFCILQEWSVKRGEIKFPEVEEGTTRDGPRLFEKIEGEITQEDTCLEYNETDLQEPKKF